MRTLDSLSQNALFYLTEVMEAAREEENWALVFMTDLLSHELELLTPPGDHPTRQVYVSELTDLGQLIPDMKPADVLEELDVLLTKYTRVLEVEG